MSAARIVVDCDPGHDDAIALLLAAGDPRVEVVAITTVAGNGTLERVTENARMTATVAGPVLAGVPIVAGAGSPLVRPLRTAPDIHGESGLDGPAPVAPRIEVTPGHAADAIARAVLEAPGEVTVFATGPLTNLALSLRLHPEIAAAARRVVLMGGSHSRGNVTPAAEFNILVDPEAAAMVFGAAWDLTMIGLDVTHRALVTPDVVARLSRIDTAAARWVGELIDFYGASYRAAQRFADPPLHDPVALACVIDPGLVAVRDAVVEIECAGRFTTGMTVVDFDPGSGARHHVGVGLDAERFWELVLGALASLP